MKPLLRSIFNATALGAALVLALALGLSALAAQAPAWAHLSLGRLLAESGSLPTGESLLFDVSAPFDAGSWAYDWCAFQAQRIFGLQALRYADLFFYGAGLCALLGACFRRGARPFSSALFLLWAAWGALPDLAPGPGLAGWCLFCAALWVCEGPFWEAFFSRWVWLPPLAALGVNLHPAAWALAPLALFWLLADGVSREPGAAPQPRLAKALYFLALLACLCLHPQGPRELLQAWPALAGPPWLPQAFAQRQAGLLLLAAAAALWAASGWAGDEGGRRSRDGWLLLCFGAAALWTRDALPYALALCAPLAAGRLDALVDALPAPLRAGRWPLKLCLLPLLIYAGLHRGLGKPAEAAALERPLQTVGFYERELIDANILAPKAWSGELAFKLAPQARFAMDERGRHGRVAEARWEGILNADEGWSQALEESRAEACWLPRGSPLSQALARSQAWQPLSFDNASVLYLKVWAPTKHLVAVHAPRGLRPGDPAHPLEPSRLGQAEADLEAALARDPKLGVLYLYQAELWLTKGFEARARQALEAGIQADPGFAENYARLAELRAKRGDKDGARNAWRHALRRKAVPAWARALEAL